MMKINEFIKDNLKVKYPADEYSSLKLKDMMTTSRLPHIVCADGFSMSVQVGFSLYSTPKKVAKRYSAVEIGFPSDHEPLIEKWAENLFEDSPDFTDTVYPYVPVKVVNEVLKKHGGIDLTETLRKEKT